MKTQSSFRIVVLTSAISLLLPIGMAYAQATTAPAAFPYQQTFIVSAYYSPIANQKKYVTGSFTGDVKLNGEGVYSADGSAVYPGMVAAPKNYAFGTKMNIPGVGIVAVHDRGGAIVNAGQKNQAFDRLDVWMGYGDPGLKRALNWGRRTVNVTVYGIDPSLHEKVDLDGYSAAEAVVEVATGEAPKTFVADLSSGDKNEQVTKLQDSLRKLGYASVKTTGVYDEATRLAVVQFQIAEGIIDSSNDFGAGFFGPQTRKTMEIVLNRKPVSSNPNLPSTQLSRDDQGDEVRKLQNALKKLGYDVESTGVYDTQTVEAIFQFQKDQKLVSSKTDTGAGVLGPKTLQVIAGKLTSIPVDTAKADTISVEPVNVFARDLKLGDRGDDVTKLQRELISMNLLGVETTGYYGEVTQHAVMKFQQAQGLINSSQSAGAGVFKSSTRARFHALIGERNYVSQAAASKSKVN